MWVWEQGGVGRRGKEKWSHPTPLFLSRAPARPYPRTPPCPNPPTLIQRFFTGSIAHLNIWEDRALTPEQVLALYEQYSPLVREPQSPGTGVPNPTARTAPREQQAGEVGAC
jgi:hypothetical protein